MSPVVRISRNKAVFQKELNTLKVSFSCGQMQGSAVIVISLCHIHSRQFVPDEEMN